MSREQMNQQLRNLTKKFEDPLPETIYHYTSPEALSGILANGEIWLTNAAFVSDPTECKLFWETAAPSLRKAGLSNPSVPDLLDKGRRPENDMYYIASFSKEKDVLQQHRAYGSICIGFDPRRMSGRPFNLYECVYALEDIEKWIREKSALPEWMGLDEESRNAAVSDLLFAAQVKYKSGWFRDEREMRMVAVSYYRWGGGDFEKPGPAGAREAALLIHADDPPIHFRDHSSYRMPIPYVKFFIPAGDAKKEAADPARRGTASQMKRRRLSEEDRMNRDLLPITEVSIGPTALKEETQLALEIMLWEKGYEHVPVQVSDIPYRGV